MPDDATNHVIALVVSASFQFTEIAGWKESSRLSPYLRRRQTRQRPRRRQGRQQTGRSFGEGEESAGLAIISDRMRSFVPSWPSVRADFLPDTGAGTCLDLLVPRKDCDGSTFRERDVV